MSKLRLATYIAGAAIVLAGFMLPVPAAQAVLVPAGTALIGLATRWPEDAAPPKKPGLDSEPK